MQQAVIDCLMATLSAAGPVRKEAEKQLRQWAPQIQFLELLLQLSQNAPSDDIKQGAALYFKLVVTQSWVELPSNPGGFVLGDPAKDRIKELLIPTCIAASSRIRKILSEALKIVADRDWPDRWPKLVEQVVPQLSFSDFGKEHHRVQGAAVCVRTALRRYLYLSTDVRDRKRWPVHRMAQICLGPYLQMLQQLAGIQTQASVELQVELVKTFWCCVQEEVPPVLYEAPARVRGWVETLVRLMVTPIPEGVQPADLEQRPQFCYWVLKKWCAKVLYRVMARHGVPGDIRMPPADPSDDIIAYEKDAIAPQEWAAHRHKMELKRQFAVFLERELAGPVFAEVLKLLGLLTNRVYLSPRMIVYLLKFVGHGIRQRQLWDMLMPQVDAFLAKVLYPLMVLPPDQRRDFYEDPQEFIMAITDARMGHSPRLQAMYVMKDLIKLRKKVHLDRFMEFLGGRLRAGVGPEEKEAIFGALGTISDELLDNKKYAPQLEGLLEQFLYPEITGGPNGGPCEWRAVWLMGRMWPVKWTRWQGVLGCCKNVVHCLQSPHLPIRLQAAEVLPVLVHLPPVAEAVESVLPHVVQQLIAISRQVDSEDLMVALEKLTDKYPQQMAPLALQLLPAVLVSFRRAVREEGETAAAAAFGALELVVRMVDECAEQMRDESTWRQLEALIVPPALELLAGEMSGGLWEMGLKLVCALTFQPPFPSCPQIWQTLPMLFKSWKTWAKDYMMEMAEAWDNFFTQDPDRCAGSEELLGAVDEMIRYGFRQDADLEEREGALKLMQSGVANLRARLGPRMGLWLGLVMETLQRDSRAGQEESAQELAALALLFVWSNPPAVLPLLQQHGLKPLLEMVCQQAPDYESKKLKKLAILGLTALLYVPPANLPPSVGPLLPRMASTLLELQIGLWEQKDEEARWAQAELDGETGYDDDDDLLEGVEHVDDGFDVDTLDVGDVDFAEGDDDMFAGMRALDEEEDLCHTLDKVDEISFWAEGVMTFSKVSPPYAQMMNSLQKEDRGKVEKLMKVYEEAKKQTNK